MTCISRAKVSKLLILQTLFKANGSTTKHLMYDEGDEPDSEFKRNLTAFNNKIRHLASDQVPLHLPGQVLHIRLRKNGKCCSSREAYAMVPIDGRSDLADIVLSQHMFTDHLPNRYEDELVSLVLKRKMHVHTT